MERAGKHDGLPSSWDLRTPILTGQFPRRPFSIGETKKTGGKWWKIMENQGFSGIFPADLQSRVYNGSTQAQDTAEQESNPEL
jgi:hypothetical protein